MSKQCYLHLWWYVCKSVWPDHNIYCLSLSVSQKCCSACSGLTFTIWPQLRTLNNSARLPLKLLLYASSIRVYNIQYTIYIYIYIYIFKYYMHFISEMWDTCTACVELCLLFLYCTMNPFPTVNSLPTVNSVIVSSTFIPPLPLGFISPLNQFPPPPYRVVFCHIQFF